MKAIFTNRKTWIALGVLALLAGVAFWQRQPVLAWYHVRQLSFAYQENRENCAKRVADLDEAALPAVLAELRNPDAVVCSNMQYALQLMTTRWGIADPRSQRLVEKLHGTFAEFSPVAQEKVLILLTGMLQLEGPRPLPPGLTKYVSEMLVSAEQKEELRAVSLLLAAELVDCVEPGQWVDVCGTMAERGMQSERPGARVGAMQLLMRAPMRKDKGLMEKAVPLLRDAEPAVRRAALVVLASESDVVREESFLPMLHDDDAETQYLCEMALRKRGLSDDDLKLARMISDRNPATRMHVLRHIPHMPDVNIVEFLRRLSSDPEPAVRAAAVRAAADYPWIDLTQRLREIAERDPSEAVRQNARYYLQMLAPRTALK
ncbi:MAG: HEAT repeat domain-containing protein [Planctomycetes bacterium]|nr:HEAT repeat domain-containing protein [Planctomycetota bacterium]